MAIHHYLMMILVGKLVGKAVDAACDYVKKLVQGLAMCWVAVNFVALFIAKYQEEKSWGNSPALSYPNI